MICRSQENWPPRSRSGLPSEIVKDVRLRRGGSRLRSISITFPASTALPLETRHSTPVSSSRASATLLPSERGANLRDVQALLPLPRSPRRPTTSQSLCHYHSPQCRLLFVGFRDHQGNRVEREPIIRRRRGNTRPPRWHYPQDRRRQAG